MASQVNKEVEVLKVETAANETSEKVKLTESPKAKVVEAPAQPAAATPAFKEIVVDLSPTTSPRCQILSSSTAEKNQMLVTNGKISLTRGQQYRIPIRNKALNLDTSYFAKVTRDLRSYVQILDVEDGFVTLLPLIHNTIIKDGDVVGLML